MRPIRERAPRPGNFSAGTGEPGVEAGTNPISAQDPMTFGLKAAMKL